MEGTFVNKRDEAEDKENSGEPTLKNKRVLLPQGGKKQECKDKSLMELWMEDLQKSKIFMLTFAVNKLNQRLDQIHGPILRRMRKPRKHEISPSQETKEEGNSQRTLRLLSAAAAILRSGNLWRRYESHDHSSLSSSCCSRSPGETRPQHVANGTMGCGARRAADVDEDPKSHAEKGEPTACYESSSHCMHSPRETTPEKIVNDTVGCGAHSVADRGRSPNSHSEKGEPTACYEAEIYVRRNGEPSYELVQKILKTITQMEESRIAERMKTSRTEDGNGWRYNWRQRVMHFLGRRNRASITNSKQAAVRGHGWRFYLCCGRA